MAHLAARGVIARSRRRTASGEVYSRWPGGRRRSSISSKACGRGGRTSRIAPASAKRSPGCISRAATFRLSRKNALSVAGWRPLFDRAASHADDVQHGLRDFMARELDHLEANWPSDLPVGVIHADLFPDNVFFLGDKLSGLIDFPFACNDILAYDIAICLNAWCFEADHSFNVTKARAFLNAYGRERKLSEAEQEALPLLARGAALRFLLTRLVDFLNVPAGALVKPKDPLEYVRKLRFHQSVASIARLRRRRFRAGGVSDSRSSSLTDGACSGNPGPGGWGAILQFGDVEKELNGGEPHTTNNRMELLAAISALEALKKPGAVDLTTDSQYVRQGISELDPRLEAERLADRRQEAGQERRPVAAARCGAGAARGAMALGQRPCRP